MTDVAVGTAILAIAAAIGLATASHYGITIDEFNTDDSGPKAIAWYASGFTDRSLFTSVEDGLWYYGPWFQMLTAFVQSLHIADHLAVRHALTFAVGMAGVTAILPIARLAAPPWAGPAALILCLTTGYFYGHLFFTPIDVPFLAAMMVAILSIMMMARRTVPSWTATFCAGLASGLAIATRTGGIIAHAYLVLAMLLCAGDAILRHQAPAAPRLIAIALRTAAAITLAWLVAIALWPWLQLGNPFRQFAIAYTHFANIDTEFEFHHWGGTVLTTDLPRSYIPMQMLARLPEGFLVLLAGAIVLGIAIAWGLFRKTAARLARRGVRGLHAPAVWVVQRRLMLIVIAAAAAPLAYVIVGRATIYDGFRHILFVVPMLAILAGAALAWALPRLRGWRPLVVLAAGAHVVATTAVMARLHPLEYVAMNSFAGGTKDAYGRFELDYWSAAATEALRRLEERLDKEAPGIFARNPPSIVVCIPYREYLSGVMLRRNWRLDLDPNTADYVIESQRARCANRNTAVLIDEVKRVDRAFAWTYVNRRR